MDDDDDRRGEVLLDRPDIGLYMPAIRGHADRLLPRRSARVFVSLPYDSADCIRDYDEFVGSSQMRV